MSTRLTIGLCLVVLGIVLLGVFLWQLQQSRRRAQEESKWRARGGYWDSMGHRQPTDRRRRTNVVGAVLSLGGVLVGLFQVWQAEDLFDREARANTPYVGELPPLEGRAREPTDIMANGLRLTDPSAKFTFTNLRNVPQTITYQDWNTIVGTTRVPEVVTVQIDGAFEPSATTLRRTQYLANLVGVPPRGQVKGKSIISFRLDEKTVISLLFIVNGREESAQIGALDYRQTTPGGKVLLDTHFEYSDPPNVPGMTSYFTSYVWPSESASRVTPEELGGTINTSLEVIYRTD